MANKQSLTSVLLLMFITLVICKSDVNGNEGKYGSSSIFPTIKTVMVFVNCSECYANYFHRKCRNGCNKYVPLPVSYTPEPFQTAKTEIKWQQESPSNILFRPGKNKFMFRQSSPNLMTPLKQDKVIAPDISNHEVSFVKSVFPDQLELPNNILFSQESDKNKYMLQEPTLDIDEVTEKAMEQHKNKVIAPDMSNHKVSFVKSISPDQLELPNNKLFPQESDKNKYILQESKLAIDEVTEKATAQYKASLKSDLKDLSYLEGLLNIKQLRQQDSTIIIFLAIILGCLVIILIGITIGFCCLWKQSKQPKKMKFREISAFSSKPMELQTV